MDGFFQYGLHSGGGFPGARCGKTLWQKAGISGRFDPVGGGRCIELFLGNQLAVVCAVFLHGVFWHRVCEQPELGAGAGYR
ncbi:hypothetical protein D3C71_1847370 [compost metagenome]